MRSLEEREQREYERREIVRKAVEAADRLILDGSDGSAEETDYLTSEVARQLMERALRPFGAVILRKDLES